MNNYYFFSSNLGNILSAARTSFTFEGRETHILRADSENEGGTQNRHKSGAFQGRQKLNAHCQNKPDYIKLLSSSGAGNDTTVVAEAASSSSQITEQSSHRSEM